jgi:cation diffusion facilitator CzcD-associated flavoprotein CzcO
VCAIAHGVPAFVRTLGCSNGLEHGEEEMGESRVIVVGAGPAGLASAAELGRRGVSVTVLERADAVASSWRGRYDRLRLNSSRPFSKLPGERYVPGTPTFPSRDEVVAYLEGYAKRNRIEVRLGTRLARIDRNGDGWLLQTSAGDLAADHVIVAAGYEHTPIVPDWPGRDRFEKAFMHAGEYRNPEPFSAADVLVVGPGCSGMEIAYELAANGAGRVRLAVRTPPNILLRDPAGPLFANALRRLPPRWGDAVVNRMREKKVGDLTEFGLPVPEEGVFSRLKRLSVAPAIVDKEVIQAIKDRRIEIVAAVESLDETGVTLADGSRIDPDAVIAATGYRPGLEPLVGHLGVLNERGVPHVPQGQEAAPGLRFVGYRPLPAHIGHMGREAKRAAKEIAGATSQTASVRALTMGGRPQAARS